MQPNERHTVYAASGRPYRLPIDAVQFRSLLLYVDEMCALHGCDNTLTHAHTWARANGRAMVEPVAEPAQSRWFL